MLQKTKTDNKKTKRLDSIKNAHSIKKIKSTRMEDYLEVISELIELKGYATASAISNYMNVSPPSVTKMLQKLDMNGYIEYTKYRGLSLTPNGKHLANEIRQKHSDLLDFFEMIGVNKAIANKDVEEIEHYFNPKTMRQLRKFMTFLKSKPDMLTVFNKTSR